MSGTLVSLYRKTDYNFTVSASLATEVVLVPLVDTTSLTSGVILWRVYAATIASGSLNLALRNVMIGPDDPNTVVAAPSTSDIGTAITASASPQLYATNLTTPIGRYLRVLAKIGIGTAGASITVTMAADLLIRDT